MQTGQTGSGYEVSSPGWQQRILQTLDETGSVGFFAPRDEVDRMMLQLGQAGVRPEFQEDLGCYAVPAGAIAKPDHPVVQRYAAQSDSFVAWAKDREGQAYLEAVCFGAAEGVSQQPEMARVRETASADLERQKPAQPEHTDTRQLSGEETALYARARAASAQRLKLVAAYIRGGFMLASDHKPARRDEQLHMIREASKEEIAEVLDRTVKRFQALDNKEKFERFDHAIKNNLPEVEKLARGLDNDPVYQEHITGALKDLGTAKDREARFVLRGAFMRFEFSDQKRLGGEATLKPEDRVALESLRRGFNALEKAHGERFGMPSGFRLTSGRSAGGLYQAAMQAAPGRDSDGETAPKASEPAPMSRLQQRRRQLEQSGIGM